MGWMSSIYVHGGRKILQILIIHGLKRYSILMLCDYLGEKLVYLNSSSCVFTFWILPVLWFFCHSCLCCLLAVRPPYYSFSFFFWHVRLGGLCVTNLAFLDSDLTLLNSLIVVESEVELDNVEAWIMILSVIATYWSRRQIFHQGKNTGEFWKPTGFANFWLVLGNFKSNMHNKKVSNMHPKLI